MYGAVPVGNYKYQSSVTHNKRSSKGRGNGDLAQAFHKLTSTVRVNVACVATVAAALFTAQLQSAAKTAKVEAPSIAAAAATKRSTAYTA